MPRFYLKTPKNPDLCVELFINGTLDYAIGRGYDNNLILLKNKLISRRHCQLIKESNNTILLMSDSDVNGVVVNGRLLILSGETVVLHDKDEFYIVHSRKFPHKNFPFTLHIEKTPQDEEEAEDVGNGDTQPSEISLPLDPDNLTILGSFSHDVPSQSPEEPKVTQPVSKSSDEPVSTLSKALKASLKPEVQLSSSLQCSICLSILYDPVTLSPCMHNFCSGCCSGWLATNRRCPSCRHKISLLSKNPSLRQIVDAYVAANPSAAKPQEEIDALNAANRLIFDRPFIKGNCLPLNTHGGPWARRQDENNQQNSNNNQSLGKFIYLFAALKSINCVNFR